MRNTLNYRGYYGSVEISPEDRVLFGRLLFIGPLVNYEAESAQGLEQAFQAAVDDYLADCKQHGIEPEKPCKGTFNVRLGAELHLAAAVAAHEEATSLNDLVKQAVIEKVQQRVKAV
jgi:predicted HicB family RNase H-like nuclease